MAKSNDCSRSVRKSHDTDPRVDRTTRRLGRALTDLIQERDFDDITVQSILDRARVSRATFYAHYRNKEDALHSAYEGVFSAFERQLVASTDSATRRLFPVTEFAAHVADVRPLMRGLRSSGRWAELLESAVNYVAAIIDKQLDTNSGGPTQRRLASRMLAGALMEAIQWWLEHPSSSNPRQLDLAFHALARSLTSDK